MFLDVNGDYDTLSNWAIFIAIQYITEGYITLQPIGLIHKFLRIQIL